MEFSASPYNCDVTTGLPFGGAEVLALSLVFIMFIVTFCVTFFDVGIKQMWPAKFLDPAAQARVAAIQAKYPNILNNNKTPEEVTQDEEQEDETAKFVAVEKPTALPAGVTYTKIVSPEPYIAGLSVDDDLVHILANNSAFSSVSSYCSSTVRGYAMLSTTLVCAGISLGYLWTHNAMIDPHSGTTAGKISLLGYVMVFLTGIVMCGPNGHAVHRNANIALFTNIPMTWNGKSNPLLKLHVVGVVSFCLLPLLGHGYRALSQGKTMPNYTETLVGCSTQLSCAVCYGIASWLTGKNCSWFPRLTGMKVQILCEIALLVSSFIAFLQFEFYATAVCANYLAGFNAILLSAVFAPFAFIAKHYCFAPTSFATGEPVLLMNNSTPVALAGPCSTLSYDGQDIKVPHLD